MRRSISRPPPREPTPFTCWQAILNLGFLPHHKPKGPPRYIATGEGWIYLTMIMDLYDRKVIGWALSKSMKAAETTIPAWQMAIKNRPIERNLIFHSDRGVQYACHAFTKLLKNHPLVLQSMSGKGNCWDNAVAESFFKSLKSELVYQQNFQTRATARQAVFEYIEICGAARAVQSSTTAFIVRLSFPFRLL